MKNYSQTFVQYHGCGNSYLDGTNMLIETGRRCAAPTYNPFRKRPIDVNNKIAKSTRNKLKIKSRAFRSYMLHYAKFAKNFHKNEYHEPYFIDDNESLDIDTDSENSDIESNESTAGNATETEQNLTDSELNKLETEEKSMNTNTGDTLIIVINDQNSNNKETNNKIVPYDI